MTTIDHGERGTAVVCMGDISKLGKSTVFAASFDGLAGTGAAVGAVACDVEANAFVDISPAARCAALAAAIASASPALRTDSDYRSTFRTSLPNL